MAAASLDCSSLRDQLIFWKKSRDRNVAAWAAKAKALAAAGPSQSTFTAGAARPSCSSASAAIAAVLQGQRELTRAMGLQQRTLATQHEQQTKIQLEIRASLSHPPFPTRPPSSPSSTPVTPTPAPPFSSASGGSPPPFVTLSALALPLCVVVDLTKRGHAGAQLEFVLQRVVGTPTTPGILHGMAACKACASSGRRAERLAWSKRVGCPVAQMAGICKLAALRKKALQKTTRVAAWAVAALSPTPPPNLFPNFTLTTGVRRRSWSRHSGTESKDRWPGGSGGGCGPAGCGRWAAGGVAGGRTWCCTHTRRRARSAQQGVAILLHRFTPRRCRHCRHPPRRRCGHWRRRCASGRWRR